MPSPIFFLFLLEVDWSAILQNILINVISSLLASFVFIFLLLKLLRPKFQISSFICKSDEEYKKPDNVDAFRDKYSFKLVNRSIYSAFDAKIELFLMQPLTHAGGNVNLKFKPLTIRTSGISHITRYRKNYKTKDPCALFAISVHSNDDISGMLGKENTYIELKITVRHGLTGLADTFTQQFGNTDVIKEKSKFQYAEKIGTMAISQSI